MVNSDYFLRSSFTSGSPDPLGASSPQGERASDPQILSSGSPPFWDVKFFATCLIIGILVLVSAYLEYVFYPSIMRGASFGDTQVTAHLSILTYWFDAYRCVAPSFCNTIQGVPSFDFAQLFIVILVLLLAQRAVRYYRH